MTGDGVQAGSEARARTRIIIGGLLVIAGLVAAVLVFDPASRRKPTIETNEIVDADGQLALALPVLAKDIEVEANEDGSTQVGFSMTYEVAHPGEAAPPAQVSGSKVTTPSGGTAKPDMAVITVMVSEAMGPGGPIRLSPMYRQQIEDRKLTEEATTNDYSFRIDLKTTEFLEGKGLSSKDDGTRAKALQYIDIDVQNLRDFQVVDGKYDWQQGRAYTAADEPVSGSTITDDSTITINNSTEDGVFGPDFENLASTGGEYQYEAWGTQLNETNAYATNIALAGSPVECIDQGDGSNPQGFSMLNGWDLGDDLPPGWVPPGASVTQQVNANDGLGTTSLDIAENLTAGTVQVLAAALDLTMGGSKDAVSTALLLAMGMEEFATPITVALGVPILAILGLVDGIYKAMTNSCASFANVVNLTVAEPGGAQTSVGWGDQTNGFDLTYDSASYNGAPVDTNVMTVPSNGIASTQMPSGSTPYAFHPYLEQRAVVDCGTDGEGDCIDYQGTNVIDVRWVTEPMCPYSPASQCTPTDEGAAALPEVTIPGTDLCGTDNELCPTEAAPNSDAAETSAEQSLENAGYEVFYEHNPSAAITAMAATTDGTVWAGDQSGEISELSTSGTPTPVVSDSNGAITAMAADGETLIWADDSGRLFSWDTTGSISDMSVETTAQPVHHIAADGDGLFYLAGSTELYAFSPGSDVTQIDTSDWQVDGNSITSMAASPSYLFVGFGDGYIQQCTLTDCGGTWKELHDGGFASDAQALATVGNTLYVGLADASQAQIDPSTEEVVVYSDSTDEGGQIAGMTTVDGNVFTGGCIGLQSPVSGDLLGVVVLTEVTGDNQATYVPDADYGDCQNPTETTTKYKGFDPDAYAMISTPATATHPPLVFVALSINSGNFLYGLESTNPFTDALCLADDGDCPTPPDPPAPAQQATPPSGSLGALGTPVIDSSCSVEDGAYTAASDSAPLATGLGESVTTGFQLTPPVSADGCNTIYAWNLSNQGSFPYTTWQGNAYPAAADAPTSDLLVSGSWNGGLPVEVNGKAVTTGAAPDADNEAESGNSNDNGASPTVAPIDADGAQLQADLTGADSFVLQVRTEPGADAGAASFVVNADTLTSTGQPTPAAVDLFAPPPPPPTTTTTSSPTSTTSGSSTTTTSQAPTTTTTIPPGCTVPAVPVTSKATALWPLDDRSTTALDVSGNGNDATIANAEAYDQAPGPFPGCTQNGGLVFDGSATTVTAPDAVGYGDVGLTALAFVNLPSSIDGPMTIMANDDPVSSNSGFSVQIEEAQGVPAGISFSLGFGESLDEQTIEKDQELTTGTWHLVVATYDEASKTMSIYLDGSQVATYAIPYSMDLGIDPGAEPVTLGVTPTDSTRWFAGTMADVAFVPQALTAQQVAAVWAAARPS